MISDSLGDRMKTYENVFRHKLPRRMPMILRIDGKAFHTFTKGMKKPFDDDLIKCMQLTSKYLLENVQNAKMVYTQSDEISILIDDTSKLDTDVMFDNNIQKIVSVVASMATVAFNNCAKNTLGKSHAMFDCRAFILPEEDVPNYFIWRMRDWERNSLQMVARSKYSPRQLHKKNRVAIHDMLMEKGINWSKIKPHYKNGTMIMREDYKYVSRKFDYNGLKSFIVNKT